MKTTRYVGNCQICEGDQKLHDGNMVHHGYERPGDGCIHGDCPGVGHVPYEVSCDLVKTYLISVRRFLEAREERLAHLKSGAIMELPLTDKVGFGWDAIKVTNMVVKGSEDGNKHEITHGCTRWERAYRNALRQTEGDITRAKMDIDRCVKRIAAWVKKPIRTVEEEQKKADGLREERAAARFAARTAKEDRKAATKAKQDELAARRKAIREDFEAKFTKLAEVPGPASREAAIRLLHELDKTKYRSWLWRHMLECETAFVTLGLATAEGVNGRGRPYLRWSVS